MTQKEDSVKSILVWVCWGDEEKIKEVMAAGENKDDDDKDSWEKTRQLKKEKWQ